MRGEKRGRVVDEREGEKIKRGRWMIVRGELGGGRGVTDEDV